MVDDAETKAQFQLLSGSSAKKKSAQHTKKTNSKTTPSLRASGVLWDESCGPASDQLRGEYPVDHQHHHSSRSVAIMDQETATNTNDVALETENHPEDHSVRQTVGAQALEGCDAKALCKEPTRPTQAGTSLSAATREDPEPNQLATDHLEATSQSQSPHQCTIQEPPQHQQPQQPPPAHANGHGAGNAGVIFSAPSVWISPEWLQHPVIENFYGTAPRARLNSFCEVLFSPTSDMRTTTLAEACSSYEDVGDNERQAQVPLQHQPHVVLQHHQHPLHSHPQREETSSFSFDGSDSTERLSSISNDRSLTDYEDKLSHLDHLDHLDQRISQIHGSPAGKAAPTKQQVQESNGNTKWNNHRLRMGTLDAKEIVPVPVSSSTFHSKEHQHELLLIQTDRSRGEASSGESSPTSSTGTSSSVPPSPFQDSPNSEMLRHKLLKTLIEIDDRILIEKRLAQDVLRQIKKHPVKEQSRSVVWNLLCGANTSEMSQYDGLTFIYERLSLVVRNRATNQLLRHRRHVNGILQIVTCHNPDLQLTEKQLDSFESATAMLNNDIKYSLLKKQVEWLETSLLKRREAYQHASCTNGSNCFDITPVKISMMQKLLEAVSWYRLVQTNSRDESSASFGQDDTPGSSRPNTGASDGESSSEFPRKSLQEIQVEKILNVLAGEEFYSDFSELMCLPDWWKTAQAHFENLIFSRADSRLCQLMYRISKDVVAMSEENMDETVGGREYGCAPARSPGSPRSSNAYAGASQFLAASRARSEWMKDPQPDHIQEFIEKMTRRVRKEFDIKSDVSKSLSVFIQRTVFPRIAVLCFDQRAVRDCQRKDKLWRKKCTELNHISLEQLSIPSDLACKIRSKLPSRRLDRRGHHRVYLIHAIDAFNAMTSVVPCDLLEELMHAVLVLHQEAALVLGTTQFSVETFFPLLAYVLLHCQLPLIHAQLHMLEKFAITSSNANGEESYYVYCVHAAVEFVCNFSLTSASSSEAASNEQTTTTAPPPAPAETPVTETSPPTVPAPEPTPIPTSTPAIDAPPIVTSTASSRQEANAKTSIPTHKTLQVASSMVNSVVSDPLPLHTSTSVSACSTMSSSSAFSASESVRPALSIVKT